MNELPGSLLLICKAGVTFGTFSSQNYDGGVIKED
jgi:hypothetical protein